MNKVCIIGHGNMGMAIREALESQGFPVVVCEKEDRPSEKLAGCDVCVIAVKPQQFHELAESISVDMSQVLVISIMAGISIDVLQNTLHTTKVIRSMPNLGVRVKRGVVGWIASPDVSEQEKESVREMFSCMGAQIELTDEKMIDAITAISGSGSAYFFYLTELLTKKAEAFGFSNEDARKIAENTFVGAAALLRESSDTAQELREAVTSKGGTTQAALSSLMENEFDRIFFDAIEKAKERAGELNG